MKEFAPEDIAYLAGIIDGEGSISLLDKPTSGQIQLRLSIANTYKPLIDWVQINFGGKAYRHKSYTDNTSPRWDCVITGREAQNIISKVLPYLKVKHIQADIALAFPILTPGHKYDEAIHIVRATLVKAMRKLNARGGDSGKGVC